MRSYIHPLLQLASRSLHGLNLSASSSAIKLRAEEVQPTAIHVLAKRTSPEATIPAVVRRSVALESNQVMALSVR